MKQKGPNSNEPKCNLQVIYELVKEEVAFVDDDLQSIRTGTQSATSKKAINPHLNHLSLRFSTEASLSLLQETQG